MKKYRLGYDKCFLACNAEGKELELNGEKIMDVSILFQYRVYDKGTGEEVLFSCNEDDTPQEQQIDGHCLNDYFVCSYDRTQGYIMTPTALQATSKYRIEYIADSYAKSVIRTSCYAESELIDKETFMKILTENSEFFDSSDNRSAQSGAYAVFFVE